MVYCAISFDNINNNITVYFGNTSINRIQFTYSTTTTSYISYLYPLTKLTKLIIGTTKTNNNFFTGTMCNIRFTNNNNIRYPNILSTTVTKPTMFFDYEIYLNVYDNFSSIGDISGNTLHIKNSSIDSSGNFSTTGDISGNTLHIKNSSIDSGGKWR